MKLYTENLLLTTLRKNDAHMVLNFILQNRDRLERLEPRRTAEYYTLGGQQRLLSVEEKSMKEGRSLRLWMMPKGEQKVIGSVSLYRISTGNVSSAMMGYRIDGAYEGKGLMREAMLETVKFCFQELGLHRLEAAIMPENDRSIRMIESCGFVQEGLMRQAMEIDGSWRDHFLYAIINE